ncbi:head-tail connector protein [Kluyvera intermedia]|uniref:head-tail connector protein n=1 Tax=Kluyvera intermedia TaxID=61648 RepID=UPI000789998C|nr:head-tail connector protein [Kluyvera intermedia]WQD31510.1 head-tail connector protein [Kluyvera intermedia]VDZ82842.1 Phage gp6-like head-tail connector protein [Kluyvera intermedia]
MIPSLEELYVQCRIDEGNTQEAALLTLYVESAREEAQLKLNRLLYDSVDDIPEGDETGMAITPLLKLRIMQLVNFWYDNRDQVGELPDFFVNGIRDYRLQPGT